MKLPRPKSLKKRISRAHDRYRVLLNQWRSKLQPAILDPVNIAFLLSTRHLQDIQPVLLGEVNDKTTFIMATSTTTYQLTRDNLSRGSRYLSPYGIENRMVKPNRPAPRVFYIDSNISLSTKPILDDIERFIAYTSVVLQTAYDISTSFGERFIQRVRKDNLPMSLIRISEAAVRAALTSDFAERCLAGLVRLEQLVLIRLTLELAMKEMNGLLFRFALHFLPQFQITARSGDDSNIASPCGAGLPHELEHREFLDEHNEQVEHLVRKIRGLMTFVVDLRSESVEGRILKYFNGDS